MTITRVDFGLANSTGLRCGRCGSTEFMAFGPYTDKDEPGLRMVYDCIQCGDQLRLYQATKMVKRK